MQKLICWLRCFVSLPLVLVVAAITSRSTAQVARPKLVIGIAIDQMRWDYLYRYHDRYGSGGFKRLLRDGFSCEQTHINYIPTYTGPGHASIWTGSVPALHGIAGNDWIDTRTARSVYCVQDTSVQSVGGSLKAGQNSPHRLLTTTVGDELKLATNAQSRVYGISLKDRASILPAGHSADGVYWYDDSTGRFITSTYYVNDANRTPALPTWLQEFNARRLPDSFLKIGWSLLRDSASYRQSTADNVPFEDLFPGETAPVFPHRTSAAGYGAIREIPAGNTLTLRLATALIEAERLGTHANPDLLAINLASTDYAGHNYGPNAREMEDLYIRLDADLAAFLNFLDRQLGADGYTLFVTADHGAPHNAAFLRERKISAGLIYERAIFQRLRAAADSLLASLGGGAIVTGVLNFQVYLNSRILVPGTPERARAKAVLRERLRLEAGIEVVYDMEEAAFHAPEPLATMMVNGHHPDRSGALLAIPSPGWYRGYNTGKGVDHGTWNPYDTHIPLLWYGWGIPTGSTHRSIDMTDIAPTLCALLHIQEPNGNIGTPITEILDNKKAAR